MPNSQELMSVERTSQMLGAASMAAATCSARRSFKQQRRRLLKRVTLAEQISDTSLPNGGYLWDHCVDATHKQHGKPFREQQVRVWQKKWKEFLQELRNQSVQTSIRRSRNLTWLSRCNSQHVAERELPRLIARQCVITEDYLNQVKKHVFNRSCPLEQLHMEIERAESRNAALLERLKKAEECKQRQDKAAQILTADGDVFFRGQQTTCHMIRSTHCYQTLQEGMEVTEVEKEYRQPGNEEQRGLGFWP